VNHFKADSLIITHQSSAFILRVKPIWIFDNKIFDIKINDTSVKSKIPNKKKTLKCNYRCSMLNTDKLCTFIPNNV